MSKLVQTRRLIKPLAWLIALILPLQAVQGTHVLCAVACHADPAVSHISDGCKSSRELCHSRGTHCHDGSEQPPVKIDCSSDCGRTPAECPPHCWCQRPPMPQYHSSTPDSSGPVVEVNCWASQVPAVTTDHKSKGHIHTGGGVAGGKSALEACASLCRFLA